MQESIMSAETLEEGDANTLSLINSLVTAEEEQQLQHHHAHHHHDFTELTDNHFLGDHHSATTPTLSDSKNHHDNEIHSVTDEEHLFNFNLGTGTTPTNHIHRDDDSSSHHHLVGNFDSTTSTPLVQISTSGNSLDERERLLKRISELEEQVKVLIEDGKQKTDTINVLSQHNLELTYQLQIIQYYHPELLSAIPPPTSANPTPNSPLMLSPNNQQHQQQHGAVTSPLFPNFSNPTGITPSSHFSTSPGVLSNITSPMTSPSANTPNMSNNNGISPNLQPSLIPNTPAGYYPIHHPHLMQPTLIPQQQAKNGTKKKKKKESPAVNSSSFQSPISSVTSPISSVPSTKKHAKKKRKHESDGEETSESEDDTPENSTPSNVPPLNSHLPPPPSSNLPPKPKVTLPPQPSRHLPKLPPRSLLPGMDPFAMHASTPFPFPPPSSLPHPPMGMNEHLMMDPSLLQHHMAHHTSEAPSPGAFSPMGTAAETPGTSQRRRKKTDGMENSDSNESLNPSNAVQEIKKMFGKVNNGGKRGILAVHAGDGLDAVKEVIKQTLDQVEQLKNRSVAEYNSRKENNAMNCINKALDLLHQATRVVVGGLLQLLESSISQLLDGTRDNWGLEIAKMMEKSWLDLFSVIFVESEITSYTQLGTLVDGLVMQNCLEELQSFGKSLSYFKFDHMTRVFNIMFSYLKKNNTVEWYLGFCLQIRYYKEYCAKMIELNHYEDCFNNIVNNILIGNPHASRTGDYKDEDKTYLVEYAVLCLTKIYDQSVEIVRQEYIDNHIEDSMPINLSNTLYSEMLEKIMGNCVNIQKIVLYPRELVPLLKFLLRVFPSDEAFIDGGGLGETRQDIRHLTFIADLLFILSRFILELDEYNETIDSVKAVGRKIVLECTDTLLQKLIKIRFEGAATHLKEILETNDLFKMSIAQICEKAVWIPLHQEEKDYNWKSIHDFNETLQIKQDEVAITVRGKLLDHLKILLPGISQYLSVMIDCINYALNYKIENRSNTSYEQFFNIMKRIGVHYLQSQREAQWEELLAKIYFIHSRKVKLKKMLKQWNTEFKSKMETNTNWYDQLLGENYVETEPLVILPKVEEKPPVPISALQPSVNPTPSGATSSNPSVLNNSTPANVTPTISSSATTVTSTTNPTLANATTISSGLTTQTLKRRKTKLVKAEELSSTNGNANNNTSSLNPSSGYTTASTTNSSTATEDDMEDDE